MIDVTKFKPNTVYVTYIAATPDAVWRALTESEFTRQYFSGHTIEIEPRAGGSFILRMPDGRVNIRGTVVEWSPPRRFSCTWVVEWDENMRRLPPCLVTYDIEQAGGAVRLTMTESHDWDIPEAILAGTVRAEVDGHMLTSTDAIPLDWTAQAQTLLPAASA